MATESHDSAGAHGPMEQFEIHRLVPIEIGGLDVSFTNAALFMSIAVGAIILLMVAGMRGAMVPGRVQGFVESLYEFQHNLVSQTLGESGRRYFPLVFSLFVFVLFANLLGLAPYSYTVTSHIAVTGVLALVVFILATVIGILRHGGHFLSKFVPHGAPGFLLPLIVPIEVLSYFIRPVSHSVRLFANMLAGHIMLKVFALLVVSSAITFSVLPFIGIAVITALEFLIAFLQAFVFAILTCIYLNDAEHIEH